MSLTHLSLFSGIGGLDIAAEMAGFKTVGQCEWADFQTKILEKHWPDVPRWRDIRTLTADSFYEKTGLRTVDIISGGFPCQPFSLAGKRKGEDDDRYLWPEMLRVIREIRPTWVLGENVPGIVNLALDQVLSDLESEGYSAQPFIIPACGVDAPHRRDRVAIVAYSRTRSCHGWNGCNGNYEEVPATREDNTGRVQSVCCGERGEDESGTVGMADGLSEGIHRTDSDSESKRLQGFPTEQICGGGTYRHQLDELLEATPLGLIGRTNPTWIEWLMGYPIGWTELNPLETQ